MITRYYWLYSYRREYGSLSVFCIHSVNDGRCTCCCRPEITTFSYKPGYAFPHLLLCAGAFHSHINSQVFREDSPVLFGNKQDLLIVDLEMRSFNGYFVFIPSINAVIFK